MARVFNQIAVSFLTLISFSLYSVRGATQLECGPYQCISQQVQYQCNVTGVTTMRWRIINDNSMPLDDVFYSTGSILSSSPDVFTDAPEFSTVLSSVSSSPQLINSSIIFTGQTNINGYTIECDDLGGDNEICPIVIPGIPSIPDNVTIHTFTNSSVNISWTESSSPCVTGYRYNISSSVLEENIIMESTCNSVMVEGLVPSDNQYYVSVAAIDTANRTSSGSDPVCFKINVPQSVPNVNASNTNGSNENVVNIIVTWDSPDDFINCEFYPMLTGYEVSITAGMTVNNLPGPVTLPPTATNHTFEDIPKGVDYNIGVIARNGVGSAPSDDVFYKVPGTFVQPSTTSSTISSTSGIASTSANTTSSTPARSPSFSTSASSSSRSATSTSTPTTAESDSGPPIVAIIVTPVVVILILIIIVIILVTVYCVYRNRDHGSASDPIPLKEKQTTQANQPETGQPTYEDLNNAVQHKQAPTGDLYAEPQVKPGSSGRRPPPQPQSNIPTYQDPNTIQRQQGPTGDMYAMPGRTPAISQVKKPGPGEVYADLDLSTNSPRSPQPLIPSEQQQHQPVLYSDVQHLR